MSTKTPIQPQDHRVRQLAQLRLTLRSDLRFTPHFESGEECYRIEDPTRSQFFRIGISEYLLISMFDGSTTVGDALVRLSQLDGNHALTESEATAICKWLVDSELAYTPESTGAERLAKNAVNRAIRKRVGSLNPLCMKLPLAYPNRFFTKLTPWVGWMFGSISGLLGLIIAVVAIYKVTLAWDLFLHASGAIFSPGRWIWLAVCWLALKIVHESAHAIVCRKYGGAVHEAGVIMVLFAPLAYVDLTSSWRFRSKWKRMHTAAAGMYIELWVAAIAAIVWVGTDPGLVNDLCFYLVMMASLGTIVFNANPLMRFDGYYIVSDLLEIPNLYGEGQQYLQYFGRRYVLGENVRSSLRWSPRDIFTRIYGLCAFLWRILICVSLMLAACMLFHGLGIILAVAGFALWVGVPMVRLIRHVRHHDGLHRQRQARLAIAVLTGFGLICVCSGLGWPGAKSAPVIVQYEPLAYVRASSPGFVREIHVVSGQYVSAGEPIARLENRELCAELRDLRLAIEQSRGKLRVFKQSDEMHSYQAELERVRSLKKKLQQKQEQIDDLILRAPSPGRVIARNLPSAIDTFLQQGDHLAAIGDESKKELQISISQPDFHHFEAQLARPLSIRLSGGTVMTGVLEHVDPRATNRAPHETMYASLGGPMQNRKLSSEQESEQFELLSPHFIGTIPLSTDQSKSLRVGQRGVVWFGRGRETIGGILSRTLRETIPSNLHWVEDVMCLGFNLTTHKNETAYP